MLKISILICTKQHCGVTEDAGDWWPSTGGWERFCLRTCLGTWQEAFGQFLLGSDLWNGLKQKSSKGNSD